jgi:hypothetical protein
MSEDEDKRQCGVCKTPHFERNNYYYGKLMTVRDLHDEQSYFNEKRWLINRMVHGWGVVCGLEVVIDDTGGQNESEPKKVIIKPGLAIDCCGREILVCQDTKVVLDPKKSTCPEVVVDKNKLVICLEYYECKTERVSVSGKICDQNDQYEYNRLRDSFVPVVRYSSEVNKNPAPYKICPLMENKDENIHKYLCEKIKKGCSSCPECPCLVIAEITINGSDIEIDQCSKRKIIYNNPMLFELFNCYHGGLPHIIEISWEKLHGSENVTWKEFKENVGNGLKVTFDKQMKHKTINTHTFLFSVFTVDEDTGERDSRYIPAKNITVDDITIDNKKFTTATFFVRDDWLGRIKALSQLKVHGGTFEIMLRGSSIIDEKGKALDAEFIGGKLPSGNGNQGGDFVSWFHLEKKSHYSRDEEEIFEETEEYK